MLRNLFRHFSRRRFSGGTRSVYRRPLGAGLEPLEQRRLLSVTAALVDPVDYNDGGWSGSSLDMHPEDNKVLTTATQEDFEIELDAGSGRTIDDETVDKDNLDLYTVTWSGASEVLTELTEGTDYDFSYDTGSDTITLDPSGASFANDTYKITLTGVEDDIGGGMDPDPATFYVTIGDAEFKNVIVCIGDGMGAEHLELTTCSTCGVTSGVDLTFENFPYSGWLDTDGNDSPTDSAAAATAMATGETVDNYVVSYDKSGPPYDYQSVLETHKNHGKVTGLVTTKRLTDATPAAYGAHVEHRNDDETEIANDYMVATTNDDDGEPTKPEILFGGAGTLDRTDPNPGVPDPLYPGDQGYTVITSLSSINDPPTPPSQSYPLAGLFADEDMPFGSDLSKMTWAAVHILEHDSDGYFLMPEGGKIDTAAHAAKNDSATYTPLVRSELKEFGDAVDEVFDWALGRNNFAGRAPRTDTLIVVTGDHETGGLTHTEGSPCTISWSTTGHTDEPVPIFGWGIGADEISGTYLNPVPNETVFDLTRGVTHTFQSNELTTTGTRFDDEIELDVVDVSGTKYVTLNGEKLTSPLVNAANVEKLVIDGEEGDDSIDIDQVTSTYFTDGDLQDDVTVSGGTGDDTISGSAFDDYLDGEAGDDNVCGNAGADSILGDDGNDTLEGAAGNDTLVGGNNNDTYVFDGSTLGTDSVSETSGAADALDFSGLSSGVTINISSTSAQSYGAGTLTLNSGSAIEKVYGSAYSDSITGNALGNSIYGGAGDDTVYGNNSADCIYGDSGADCIYGGSGSDYINAGTEADYVNGGTEADTVYGDSGADTIYGHSGSDSIYAGTEADYVNGGSEGDTVYGDSGADTICGHSGSDFVEGGAGADYINGGSEADSLHGYDDSLYGNDGDAGNTVCGASGADYVHGGGGADYLNGGSEDDWVEGDYGNDLIYGHTGDDYLNGGPGADCVYGGDGDDAVDINWSYDSADYASGGSGTDTLSYNDADSYENDFAVLYYCGP